MALRRFRNRFIRLQSTVSMCEKSPWLARRGRNHSSREVIVFESGVTGDSFGWSRSSTVTLRSRNA